jgi:hypothetical protein
VSTAAPDYVTPVEGWRAWSLVRDARGVHLRSVYTDASWDAGRAFIASCRRTCRRVLRPWRTFTPDHAAPRLTCTCGVYASSEVEPIARLLTAPLAADDDEIGRAIGTVALWGEVVECTRGWRASHAYPRRLYVWEHALSTGARAAGIEAVVDELSDYRVPVEQVRGAARSEVVHALIRS